MFKKAIFTLILLLNSLLADVSLGVIANHGYIEFDNISEFEANQGTNWVGIYKKGNSTNWNNVISWAWIRDLPSHGDKTYDFKFDDLDDTTLYELRFFYDNSFDIAQSVVFEFSRSKPFLKIVSHNGDTINFISSNIDLDTESWIGIYQKEASNNWNNVLGWSWVNSTTENNRDYKSTINGLTLSDGIYEARLFYHNSFDLEASYEFKVGSENLKVTLTQLKRMIKNNEDVTQLDVSGITDMSLLFADNLTFNQDISGWDVSNVTNMRGMFYHSKSFNQPIGDWDVSNVTNMGGLFGGSKSFNQPIENWDVSNVNDMSYMFLGVTTFNQPIGNWDVSNVVNMEYMFNASKSFHQDISSWNVSKVTNNIFFAHGSTLEEQYKPHF